MIPLLEPNTILEKELLKGPVIVLNEKAITANRILLPVIPGETFATPLEGNPILVDVWPIKCRVIVFILSGNILSFSYIDGIRKAVTEANLPFEVTRISKSLPLDPFRGEIRSLYESMNITENGEGIIETTVWVLRLRE